jgi:hypothetical protein
MGEEREMHLLIQRLRCCTGGTGMIPITCGERTSPHPHLLTQRWEINRKYRQSHTHNGFASSGNHRVVLYY